MEKVRIIFIHGIDCMSWKEHWRVSLKKELEGLGLETVFETFPDSILARAKYWMPFLKDYLKADERSLLIGHSSGATAAMRFAQTNKIFGSILVSPAYTDMGIEAEKLSGWYDEPWDWSAIKGNQQKIGLIYSLDDTIVPHREGDYVKEKLQPDEVLVLEDRGHFLHHKDFPELVAMTKKMLGLD